VIIMLVSQWLFLAALVIPQGTAPTFTEGILNAKETGQLARATKVEERIKVYETASKRMQQTVHALAANEKFSQINETLRLWDALLTGSIEDIEANLKTKKKSRALIRYEIQVRKALTAAQDYRNSIPPEQMEEFDAYLANAEKIRKRFVKIIFQH